jgi:hypothetical protein
MTKSRQQYPKTRTMMVGLALIGFAACGMAKGQSPEAIAEAAAKAKAATTSAAKRTPVTRVLSSGTTIDVTMGETITSRSNEAGETVTTTVDTDIKDEVGRIVIPAGSVLELTIAEITPATNRSQADGTLILQVTRVMVRDQAYPLSGEITSLSHTLKGRGVTVGEVEKVAVGTVIGAVAGRVIGGNAKGTIIGGAIGATGGRRGGADREPRRGISAGTPVGHPHRAPEGLLAVSTSRYKGFNILPGYRCARPGADSGFEIRRSGRSQPFAVDGRYRSEDQRRSNALTWAGASSTVASRDGR